MSVPGFQEIMLPLLKLSDARGELAISDAIPLMAEQMGIGKEDQNEMLPSGKGRRFDNRVRWAKTYMEKAGLLSVPGRGRFTITDRGRELLEEAPPSIDIDLLKRYPEFCEFRERSSRNHSNSASGTSAKSPEITPEELLENAYTNLMDTLVHDILERIKASPPDFFERLVVELLIRMGYGGSRRDAGKAIGRSGDGGIDGIIKEDKLGLDVIYVQAKRWEQTVGRPQIQAFVGSLEGVRARRGVFITTSNFSKEALEYVQNIEKKIVLIDGPTLAGYMIDHNVGVSTVACYEMKKVDSDFFSDE